MNIIEATSPVRQFALHVRHAKNNAIADSIECVLIDLTYIKYARHDDTLRQFQFKYFSQMKKGAAGS